MKSFPRWIGHIVAAICSFVIAFFAVFVVLFSDLFGIQAELGAIGYVLVVYFIVSVLLHWLWRGTKAWLWWLIIPAALFGGYVAISDQTRFGYILAVVLAAATGTFIGYAIFTRRGVSSTIQPKIEPLGKA